jgi:hypothetical protein
MANQIVRVRKEPVYAPTHHQHIAAVELANGARYTRAQVIDYIGQGYEFYTYMSGRRARVYVHHCPRCFSRDYITTTPDGTVANNLDNLPGF